MDVQRPYRKWIIRLAIALVVIVCLYFGLRFTLKSDWAMNYAIGYTEQTISDLTGAQFTIGNLSGDLFDGVIATDLHMSNGDTLVTIDTIRIEYRLYGLLSRTIHLKKVHVSGISAQVNRDTSGVWSFSDYLPETDSTKIDTTVTPEPSPWILRIDQFHVDNSEVFVTGLMESEDPIVADDIVIDGRFSQMFGVMDFQIHNMAFNTRHPDLEETLRLSLQMDADANTISLPSLIAHYGSSVMNASGTYDLNTETILSALRINPLAHTDIQPFTDVEIYQDLDVDLNIKGTLDSPELAFIIADGTRLILDSRFEFTSSDLGYSLALADVTGPGGNLNDYMRIEDVDLPIFGAYRLQFAGSLPVSEPVDISGDVNLSVADVMYTTYRIGKADIEARMQDGKATIQSLVRTGLNSVNANGSINDFRIDNPTWNMRLETTIASLALFDTSQESGTSFKGTIRASGSGLSIPGMRSRYDIDMRDVIALGQSYGSIQANGRINELIYIDSSLVQFPESGTVHLSGFSTIDFATPEYQFDLVANGLNMSFLQGYEELDTHLSMQILVNGVCLTEDERKMDIQMDVDSSWVNGTLIESMYASLHLDQNRLDIEDATLKSDIADGNFAGVVRIDSLFMPSNNLDFNIQIKNLQPLASLAGAEVLGARGEIRGRVEEDNGVPQMVAIIAIDDFVYDSLKVNRIVGQYTMGVQERPKYLAEIDLIDPQYNDFRFQDIRFTSRGQFIQQDIAGAYGLELNVQDNTGIIINGDFNQQGYSIRLNTSVFDIRGPLRTYSQVAPFNLTVIDNVIQSDTLKLGAPGDASLKLRIHYAATDTLALGLDVDNVNMEALQKSVMEESLFDGDLTGHLSFLYGLSTFAVDTDLEFRNIVYGEQRIDTLLLDVTIADEMLDGDLLIRHEREDLLIADLEIPFRLGDPTEFDEAFFEKPVHGSIKSKPIDLITFTDLFEQLGAPAITGILEMNTELKGIAGIPILDGTITIQDGSVAGVPIDQLELEWLYDQSKRRIELLSVLDASGQRVLTSNLSIPLNLDLRNFTKIIPNPTDSLNGDITADEFNLALLEPFLPHETVNQIKGYTSARIDISGTIGEPDLSGRMDITGGSIYIQPTNTPYRDVRMEVLLQDDVVEIRDLSIRSGSGELTLNGSMNLDGFETDQVNLILKTQNFTISDTRDLKAAVSIDADITGSYIRPVMDGSMLVNNGNIYLDNFGERTVEEIQLDTDDTYEPPSFYDSLSVRMRVQLDPNVWLRNRTSPEMALELEGDMDLLKDRGGDLQAFGSLGVRQGYAMQYGKRFQIEKGDLSFNGDPFNPQLDIVSVYQLRVPDDIEIRYLISGTVDEPVFDFSSNPEMELENIISYTLFGKPFGALFSWQQSFSGGGGGSDLARDAAIGILVDRVENLATEALGIDLLQIDTNRQGETTTTSVKAGKYITDKLFVAVLNELGGSDAITRVVLEYYIRRNLQLILTQGNDRRSGIDLLWKYEY